MHDRQTEAIARNARDLYRRQAADLPPDVTRRLASARRAALKRARGRQFSLLWLPAGAMAAGLLAIAVFQTRDTQPGEGEVMVAGTVLEDMEILLDAEDLELLEDLEFYAWLGTDIDAG